MKANGENDANKKSGVRGRRMLMAVFALVVVAAGIALFGKTLRDHLFGKSPEAPATHFGYLRLPIDGVP